MKKSKDVKREREILSGIAPNADYEIMRELQKDGSVLYFHPAGLSYEPEQTSTVSLFNAVITPIRRMKALINLLGDDDYDSFGFIAESLTGEAERFYSELFHFLNIAVGEIEVDIMDRGSIVYRPNRVLGARITPHDIPEVTE